MNKPICIYTSNSMQAARASKGKAEYLQRTAVMAYISSLQSFAPLSLGPLSAVAETK